jgi:hypothetical protein
MKTSDISLDGRLMAMFVGGNGGGKSVAAASFPAPIKFFDFDGRMKPIKLFYPNADIDYVTVGSKSNGRLGIIDFYDFCKEFESLQDNCPWATVVIDSFTNLSNTAVTYQLMARGGFHSFKGKKTTSGLPIPGFEEFNGETTSLSQILDIAKVLPCNIIFTAHPLVKVETIGENKSRRYTTISSYGTKIASFAPTMFDDIWLFERDGEGQDQQRMVWTAGRDMTKTALPLDPVYNITGRRLYPLIKTSVEAHNIKLLEKAASAAQEVVS